MPLLWKKFSFASMVSDTQISVQIGISVRSSSTCTGVKPVNSSNTNTASFKISDSPATRASTDSISSEVIHFSFLYSANPSYITCTSFNFPRKIGESDSSAMQSCNSSNETLYCINSEIRDLISPM